MTAAQSTAQPADRSAAGRPVAYTVTATLPDERTLAAYLDWLRSGHVQAVLAAGALEARIVQLIEPARPLRVQTRYVFASRAAFEAYERERAPALRAEGLARFGPAAGVAFTRELGEIVPFDP